MVRLPDRPATLDRRRLLQELAGVRSCGGDQGGRPSGPDPWRRTATPGRRCDLETGKSLNIAPPGWEQTYGPLVETCNVEHAWSRPDDPARARVQQPGHRAYIEAAELRAGTRREGDPRDVIEEYLVQRVESGQIEDRAGVVAALKTVLDPGAWGPLAAERSAVRA